MEKNNNSNAFPGERVTENDGVEGVPVTETFLWTQMAAAKASAS